MSKLVCVPINEIMDTPGIFDALHCIPARWTRRLRGMLSSEGLDTSNGAMLFEMRYEHECYEWWFCNADSSREALRLFHEEVELREDAKQARQLAEWAKSQPEGVSGMVRRLMSEE